MDKRQIIFGGVLLGAVALGSISLFASHYTANTVASSPVGSSTEVAMLQPLSAQLPEAATSSPTSTDQTATAPEPQDTIVPPATTAVPPRNQNPDPLPTPVVKASGITMAEVQAHSTKESCWTVVNDSVYDVTSFISKHPGGASKILSMCGKDSTRAFLGQHEGDRKPEALLASFRIDSLAL